MKKTKGLQVLQALNDIDDKMVEEAMPGAYRRRRTFVFTRRMTAGLLAAAAAVVLAVALPRINVNNPSSDSGTLAISGMTDYGSLAEAESAAGFEVMVPEKISGVSQSSWIVMGAGTNEVILQVYYGDDVIVRKGAGSEDISGDYNSYSWEEIVSGVRFAGADEQSVSLVTWTSDSYSYSISYRTLVSLEQAQADADLIS
ncbi:hypothetical protein [Galactobacillus timonensis]|uniref:hypothetical protein n=1 Tax=Galactobacillus timonensis TaxID=2041840 RepID=UPI000C81C3E6|nr:hypothetical protein [Galactobacillus timonensis]